MLKPDYPKRPQAAEVVYSDWDEDFGVWAVFGEDSGHCYLQSYLKREAEEFVTEHNLRVN